MLSIDINIIPFTDLLFSMSPYCVPLLHLVKWFMKLLLEDASNNSGKSRFSLSQEFQYTTL